MQDQKERQASLPPQGLSLPLSPLQKSLISTTVALGSGVFLYIKESIPSPVIYFRHVRSGSTLTILLDENFNAEAVRARIARFDKSLRALGLE